MTYQETLHWMFHQLPMYQRQGKSAYKKDLSNTLLLAAHLGNPERMFKSIHVAGTNGKGSTSHMLAAVLQEAGYKVGLYTSPHLKDFRERIRCNGDVIDAQYVVNFIKKHQVFFEAHSLSFFEMTVGMAFQYFADEYVDIAVIEVGLGGRLDSTNIITPELSLITNIGLDHTQFLGDTLSKIAYEKGGIIKQEVPVVVGEYHPETWPVFEALAKKNTAPLYLSEHHEAYNTDLLGSYQKSNMNTVLTGLKHLNGFSINEQHISCGLSKVRENTGLRGRWDVLNELPKVIADTAHNTHGLTAVMKQLRKEPFKSLHIVLGVVADKKLDDILVLFPSAATYYFCAPAIERKLPASDLAIKAAQHGLIGTVFKSVSGAYEAALYEAAPDDLVYVGGSTFVVAEII